jgi:hypothetical protein
MSCHIMIVKIGARRKDSPQVQEVLSRFGCSIRVRLGLHETHDVCSDEGILILQLDGDVAEMEKLEAALNEMDRVQAKMVVLE